MKLHFLIDASVQASINLSMPNLRNKTCYQLQVVNSIIIETYGEKAIDLGP